jgi:opacity protein-like surface antigen
MRFYLIFLVIILFSSKLYSQHSELGIGGGIAYYSGELNPSLNIMNKLRPTIGIFYRKNLNYRYSLRFGGNYAKLAAQDNIKTKEDINFFETRNFAFASTMLDAYGVIEFNFFPYQLNNTVTAKATPYVFIGVAGFYTNPEVENSTTNTSYSSSTTALAIPFGVGIKSNFIQNLGLNIEWTYRKTYSDLVDGLESRYINGYQLSNSQNNDWYAFVTISLSYKFLRKTDKCSFPIN